MAELSEFATVLESARETILIEWILRCRESAEVPGAGGPAVEMLRKGFDGFTTLLRHGDAHPLESFVDAVAAHTVAAGVGASQAIPVLLAFKPVCMAALEKEAWGASRLLWASANLDRVVGGAVSRFGERYAAQVEAALDSQLQRLKESEGRLLAQTAELAEQRRQSERRVREIDALNRGAMVLNSTLDTDQLMQMIVERAADLMGTALSAVFRWDGEMGRLEGLAATGMAREVMGRMVAAVSLRPGDVRQVIQEHRAVFLPDMDLAAGRIPLVAAEAAREQGIRAVLAAPLVMRDRLFGYLATYYLSPRAFDDHDVTLLSAFAEYAAAALENARLYGQARHLATLEERNRLAREIHDTLAQGLSGLVLQLQGVGRYLRRDPEVAQEELAEAVRLARGALQEARRSVWELRARAPGEATLEEVLRSETARIRAEGLETVFHLEGDPVPLEAGVEHNLSRIAQEALANVRRHARARAVALNLRFSPTRIELEVRDDGVGFEQVEDEGTEAGHFGLLGMRERARLMGGELALESAPGEGTRVCVWVPVTARKKVDHAD